MPDDYYVSQYSGEEIDALLGIAGAGAVRYDAAQSLNDAQKTQARGNIAAAPSGYGLGGNGTEVSDWNNATENGFYRDGKGTEEKHSPFVGVWSCGYVTNYSSGALIQVAFGFPYVNGKYVRCEKHRGYANQAWDEWEWVNPPMQLGVEYRTTERYLGKPVYTQIINCGSMPDIGSEKTTSIAAFNVDVVAFISGWCTHYGTTIEPNIFGIALSANANNIRIQNLNREVNSDAVMYTLVKYTKKTD